jgi:methenyltetrahydrofolate cyclohydrolase
MPFHESTIRTFIDELSSKAPVPGGGGASALVGALAGALTHMVAALTVGKPKYAAVEPEMHQLLAQSEAIVRRFLSLMDEDAAAFEPLAQAYRLPKETDEQKEKKAHIMENALKSAVQPPLRIMETCADAISLIALCADKGSVVAVSDAGVAASLCRAALEGASLNVFINTQAMQDRPYADALNARARDLLQSVTLAADAVYQGVSIRLGA